MGLSKQDQELFNSLKEGDSNGIQKIYQLYFPKVSQYLYKHGGSDDDISEIVQKALLQIITRMQDDDFVIKSTFEGYFFTCCKNIWKRDSKMRYLRVTNDTTLALYEKEEDLAISILEQEKWELFQEKLLEISENCQKVLKLVFAKVSYQEIAKQLGYSNENTLRQRVFNCKAKLKGSIQSDPRYKELKKI